MGSMESAPSMIANGISKMVSGGENAVSNFFGGGMVDPAQLNQALATNPALAGLTPQSFAPGQIAPPSPPQGNSMPSLSGIANSPMATMLAGKMMPQQQQPQASPLRPAMPGQSGPPQVQTPQAAPNMGAPMAGGPMNMSSGLTPQQLAMIQQLTMRG